MMEYTNDLFGEPVKPRSFSVRDGDTVVIRSRCNDDDGSRVLLEAATIRLEGASRKRTIVLVLPEREIDIMMWR
jgi:hypothetical protein